MLLGELIITDCLIAYMSHKFERYCLDLAVAWKETQIQRSSLLWALVGIFSCLGYTTIQTFPMAFCWTSPANDELDFVLTSCPPLPSDITEMTRVSQEYQEEWERHN